MRRLDGHGTSSGITQAMLGNLAELLSSQGQAAEAEALYREAIEGRRRTLGENHAATKQLEEALQRMLKPDP